MSLETANAARGRWPGILQTLGVEPKFLVDKHGPCPICSGKDRFRFDDKLNGQFFCSHCGAGDGFKLLELLHGWPFKKAASEVDQIVGRIPATSEAKPKRSESDNAKACRKILEGAGRVVEGTPSHAYLLRRCGEFGPFTALRNHPGIRHTTSGGIHPALLAILTHSDGSGCSVHRTYLNQDGEKAMVDPVRKMMPGTIGGASIRLGPVMERMGIAEGIETAICAGKLFNLPVWSAVSANGLIAWNPPEGCREVLICADNDANFVGYDAALDLGKRLQRLGIKWEIRMPDGIGQDWCDVFSQHHAAS